MLMRKEVQEMKEQKEKGIKRRRQDSQDEDNSKSGGKYVKAEEASFIKPHLLP